MKFFTSWEDGGGRGERDLCALSPIEITSAFLPSPQIRGTSSLDILRAYILHIQTHKEFSEVDFPAFSAALTTLLPAQVRLRFLSTGSTSFSLKSHLQIPRLAILDSSGTWYSNPQCHFETWIWGHHTSTSTISSETKTLEQWACGCWCHQGHQLDDWPSFYVGLGGLWIFRWSLI